MILIPEQVKALRDKINDLEEKIQEEKYFFKNDERNQLEPGFVNYVNKEMEIDDYNFLVNKLEYYKRVLENSEFVKEFKKDLVDYGTKFKIKYYDDDDVETYTLVENSVGLKSTYFNQDNGYISVDGYLGKTLKGKKTGDEFSYEVMVKGSKHTIKITGKIIEIIAKTSSDINYITSKTKDRRIARNVAIKRKKIYARGDKREIDKLNEITLSQYNLLKEEQHSLVVSLSKLEKYENRIRVGSIIKIKNKFDEISEYTIVDKEKKDVDPFNEIDANSLIATKLFTKRKGEEIRGTYHYKKCDKDRAMRYEGIIVEIDNSMIPKEESIYDNINNIHARLRRVNMLIEKSKITTPPTDGTIGIGSKVSIMTFENGEVQNRRVEIINHAVSTELTSDYIEAISPLGNKILGLKNNDSFMYYYYCQNARLGQGIVYDINNNMNETLAKDPLTYQKRRRG